MYFEQFFIKGLGCMSYLVGCKATGEAAVIDPDRDISRYVETAAREDLRIVLIVETHLHADHVSGNTALAKATGGTIAVHEAGNAKFPHQALKDGDELALGNIRLRVRFTPGHTPESISLEVIDRTRSEAPWFILTGDTLFVADIGRPDLVGNDSANQLAHQLYDSLFGKILTMDDAVAVYPGHGAGSLCGRSIGDTRSTTLGFERRFNRSLQIHDRERFASHMTRHLPQQPGNFSLIKAANINGPAIIDLTAAHAFSPAEVRAALDRGGATLLDLRAREARDGAALAGTPWLPADDQLPNRVGFVIPVDHQVILLLDRAADFEQHAWMLARVGYDHVTGYATASPDQWAAAGLTIHTDAPREIKPQDLEAHAASGHGLTLVDVREPWEYRQQHVPGAINIPLGQLMTRAHELPLDGDVAAICEAGSRSLAGAALLDRFAAKHVYSVAGGTSAWAATHAREAVRR